MTKWHNEWVPTKSGILAHRCVREIVERPHVSNESECRVKFMRQFTSIQLGLILMVFLVGCSLAPSEIDPPPIFELNGRVTLEESEVDVNQDTVQILLALSWYVFTTNSLDPAPFSLAAQTVTSSNEDYEFALALSQVPPPSAFMPTGADQFLELPAEGNLAIGFITARPWA